MLVGLILLAASTFLLCFMNGIPMLLLGRIFQGLTSSLTWSVGLALVTDTVPSDYLGRSMGWVGIAVSLGTLSSPLLGGVVYGKGGYYQVWAMCFALVAGDIILRLVIIEKKHAVKWFQSDAEPPIKAPGHPLTEMGANKNPEGDTSIERKDAGENETIISPNPENETVVDPSQSDPESGNAPQPNHLSLKSVMVLFTSTRLLSALWGTAIEGALLTALDSTVPLEVNRIFGWDSIGAGLIFLPLLLPTFLGPVVGIMSDRYGPRWLSTAGFLITVPFLICMRFVTENTLQHKVMLCGMMAGTGLGVTLCFGPLTAEISWAVEEGYKGPGTKPIALAYGLYNVAFSLGTIIGPLLGGFIRDSKGWGTESWSLAILSFVTAIVCALWAGGPPLWKMKSRSRNQVAAQ